jgi:uncharacterized membrane protein
MVVYVGNVMFGCLLVALLMTWELAAHKPKATRKANASAANRVLAAVSILRAIGMA